MDSQAEIRELKKKVRRLEKAINELPIERQGKRFIIKAHELHVVNMKGETRIKLEAFTKPYMRMGHWEQCGNLDIYDSKGNGLVWLNASGGIGSIDVFDNKNGSGGLRPTKEKPATAEDAKEAIKEAFGEFFNKSCPQKPKPDLTLVE